MSLVVSKLCFLEKDSMAAELCQVGSEQGLSRRASVTVDLAGTSVLNETCLMPLSQEYYYFFGLGCAGVSADFAGLSGGTEPAGVGVMGREGVSHDLFILCRSTFLLGCWVDFFSLAILCDLL